MSVIRWQNPPAAHGSRKKAPRRTEYWRAVADELRQRPGEWGVVLEIGRFGDAGGTAGQIKSARLVAFAPAGSFEATTRTDGDLYSVYARYVGTPESAA